MIKWLKKIKFLLQIHKSIPMVFRYAASKNIPFKKKLISFALLIGYIVLPTDIIMDAIPFLGWFDDVTIVSYLLDRMKKEYTTIHHEDIKNKE